MDIVPRKKALEGRMPEWGSPGTGDYGGIQAGNLEGTGKHFSQAGQPESWLPGKQCVTARL